MTTADHGGGAAAMDPSAAPPPGSLLVPSGAVLPACFFDKALEQKPKQKRPGASSGYFHFTSRSSHLWQYTINNHPKYKTHNPAVAPYFARKEVRYGLNSVPNSVSGSITAPYRHCTRRTEQIIHGSAHRGANGVAMPTDEDDQDGHFFYNHPERGAYSAA